MDANTKFELLITFLLNAVCIAILISPFGEFVFGQEQEEGSDSSSSCFDPGVPLGPDCPQNSANPPDVDPGDDDEVDATPQQPPDNNDAEEDSDSSEVGEVFEEGDTEGSIVEEVFDEEEQEQEQEEEEEVIEEEEEVIIEEEVPETFNALGSQNSTTTTGSGDGVSAANVTRMIADLNGTAGAEFLITNIIVQTDRDTGQYFLVLINTNQSSSLFEDRVDQIVEPYNFTTRMYAHLYEEWPLIVLEEIREEEEEVQVT